MNVSKAWNLHGQTPHAKLAERFVNLKIQLEWNEWTPCNQGETTRSREGFFLKPSN